MIKNKERSRQWLRLRRWFFRRKRNSETYPCPPSFLIVNLHSNDNCHYNDYNRPSGMSAPFRDTEKVSCPDIVFTIFSHCHNIIYPLLTPCIPCTLARCDFSFAVITIHYLLAFLTFWHFESVQECKVCMGRIAEFTSTPPHFLHFLHFQKCG